MLTESETWKEEERLATSQLSFNLLTISLDSSNLGSVSLSLVNNKNLCQQQLLSSQPKGLARALLLTTHHKRRLEHPIPPRKDLN